MSEDEIENQFARITQLNILREEYARLWRSNGDLKRIHELERLLEAQLTTAEPIVLPDWFAVGIDGPLRPPRTPRELHTCQQLIDPVLVKRGWMTHHITREETFTHCRDRRRYRVDYALRMKVSPRGQFRLVAFIEAKHEGLSPMQGLEQVKHYATGRRERIPFVFSTNGRFFMQFDRRTKALYGPYPFDVFPTPADLLLSIATKDCIHLDSNPFDGV